MHCGQYRRFKAVHRSSGAKNAPQDDMNYPSSDQNLNRESKSPPSFAQNAKEGWGTLRFLLLLQILS